MNAYTVYEDVADLGFPVEADSFKDAAEKFAYMLASQGEGIPETVVVQLGADYKHFECSSRFEVVAREVPCNTGGEA